MTWVRWRGSDGYTHGRWQEADETWVPTPMVRNDERSEDVAPKQADASADPICKAVGEVIFNLERGHITPQARGDLRRALDKADAQLTGRAVQDHALGRAIR